MDLAAAVIVMVGGAQSHPELDAAAAEGSVNLAFIRVEDAPPSSGASEEGASDGDFVAAVISMLRRVDRYIRQQASLSLLYSEHFYLVHFLRSFS